MKKMLACFFVVVVISGFSSFGFADGWGEPTGCGYKQYRLDAEKFFLYITQDTPYTSWQLWPNKEKLYPGKEPHGSFLTTYVNPVAYGSITHKRRMAFGSLIVVENYDPDKKLVSLTLKIKIKGYNPQEGDWYWFKYARDGKVIATGKAEMCLECHRKMKENDYIMTAPVK